MSSDRPSKLQWSNGHGRWGANSGFSNGQTNSNSLGHSTTGQMGLQWNSSNSQAGQNQARWLGSRHGQGSPSKVDRKVIFLIYSAILLKYLLAGS